MKIRKLGELLGVTLYRRAGRELQLTDAGKRVAAFARDMQNEVEEFRRSLSGAAEPRPVKLTAGEGSLLYLLPEALREFVRASRVPLEIVMRDREGMINAIRSGEADIGVGTIDVLPEDLATTRLVRAEQVVVMPRRHALAKKRQIAIDDLEGESLIVPPAGRPHRESIARAFLDRGVPWRVAVEANGWPVMLELVRAGAGIAIVNSTCRLPPGLVARPLLRFPATYYHMVHRRRRLPDGCRLLVDLIQQHTR